MAQEHQEYIQQKVNPILENLVTQLLLERPEALAPFMIKWLSEHTSKTPAAVALTEGVNELSAMKSELEKLQEEVRLLEAAAGTGAGSSSADVRGGAAGTAGDEEETDEEDDDEVDDAEVVRPPDGYFKKERSSVSAEAYGQWNKVKAFTPPVHEKTEAQKDSIKEVLSNSFLFALLEKRDLDIVIAAMLEKSCMPGERLIEQGADGDCLYVVQEGQMNCYKKQADNTEKLVKECRAGDAFGELALLYNCPRAASVVASSSCTLWQLDRETFNHIVRDASAKRRERYEEFLKQVPLLEAMDSYERTQMCDALQTESHPKGATIVQQGEPGEKFYILEEGECKAMKVYAEGTAPQEVMHYKSGMYFGELALLTNERRAASIVAMSDVKCLTLSRKVFKQLLGSLEDILTRNRSQYKS